MCEIREGRGERREREREKKDLRSPLAFVRAVLEKRERSKLLCSFTLLALSKKKKKKKERKKERKMSVGMGKKQVK